MKILTNSIVLLGVSSQWQTIVTGVVMIVAVFMDLMKRKSKVRA